MKNDTFKTLLLAMVYAGSAIQSEETPFCGPRPCSIDVRHLEYQGIGFNEGYTSFDLFLANRIADPLIYFIDTRAHVFNDGKPALNAGSGWRYSFDSGCHAIGFNAYYDYRRTKRFHYNQIGAGFEYLTPNWQLTANGYFPFGRKVSKSYELGFDGFAGNNFFVSRKYEFAMIGGDMEAGWHFKRWDKIDLFAGIGPYYFQGQLGKAAIGAKARIEARITPYLKLEMGDSYDSVFKNRFHAEVTLSIPFGPRSRPKSKNCCSCHDQLILDKWLHSAPARQEIVVVDHKNKRSLGLDPVTGQPFFMIFVDNTSSSNGTFESPYASLAAAETASKNRDVIYVFPGDGTTNNMSAGITLKENQRLLGSGISHAFNTTHGEVSIPAQSTNSPSITNIGSVVTLDINNEVSGFNILGGTAGIMSGAWMTKTLSVDINNNQFLYTQGNAIQLLPASARPDIYIRENTIFSPTGDGINCPFDNALGNVTIQGNSIFFTGANGVNMTHTGLSTVFVDVSNNTISNFTTSGIFVDAQGSAGVICNVTTTVSNNTLSSQISSSGPSIHARTENDSRHISNIFKNRIENAFSSQAILVEDTLSTSLSFTGTSVRNNRMNAVAGAVYVLGDFSGNGTLDATIELNSSTNASSGPEGVIAIAAFNTQTVTGTIRNNSLGSPLGSISGAGIRVHLASTTGNITVSENLVSYASTPYSITCDSGNHFLNIHSNRGQNNYFTQLDIVVNGGITRAIVENNSFTDSLASSGSDFLANVNTGTLCLRLQDNVTTLGYSLMSTDTLNFEYPATNVGDLHFGSIPSSTGIILVPPGTCN